MDKVVNSAAEAVADIKDGDAVGVSGFGVSHGFPTHLIAAAAGRDVRDLTLVTNSLGGTGVDAFLPEAFVKAGRVSKLVASFSARAGGKAPSAERVSAVKLDIELVPQGILVERLRAAGAGIGPFYSPVGATTTLAEGKEKRTFDRDYVLEHPLHLDFALIYAAVADRAGNVAFLGASQNLGPSFAKAAKTTIVQVDKVVEVGELSPAEVDLPGIFVDRVVESSEPRAATWPPTRDNDERRQYGGKVGWAPSEMGARIAALLPEHSYVNLGVGLPTQVSDYITERDIVLHAENGALGYQDRPPLDQADMDAFNAGGEPVTFGPGASVFDSVSAFEMARGGHLDAVILGAFQVQPDGSFANWTTREMGGGAIGGAMDLTVNPGKLIIAMRHTERNGQPKLVSQCQHAHTDTRCVDLVVTDLAVIERDEDGFVLRDMAPGFTPEEIIALTEAPLRVNLWA
ncbi:3-oxoacid CoA-transferase subunit A [Rhodococcus sp. T2V]|uniref:3-oxoacid CoA-transferase n=1 Tax=Rhodococcus sp. T2V TaxID=3034164 RepID=UPI0023E301DD|nr:3-oxoacid CoA-transferase subunit A [Rhodococcus sp. T2V]MDF3311872.1 3-oxoacid CoA-transferase subunit A [Rhodococcus sp. T2V]